MNKPNHSTDSSSINKKIRNQLHTYTDYITNYLLFEPVSSIEDVILHLQGALQNPDFVVPQLIEIGQKEPITAESILDYIRSADIAVNDLLVQFINKQIEHNQKEMFTVDVLQSKLDIYAKQQGIDVDIIDFAEYSHNEYGIKISIGSNTYLFDFSGNMDELLADLKKEIDSQAKDFLNCPFCSYKETRSYMSQYDACPSCGTRIEHETSREMGSGWTNTLEMLWNEGCRALNIKKPAQYRIIHIDTFFANIKYAGRGKTNWRTWYVAMPWALVTKTAEELALAKELEIIDQLAELCDQYIVDTKTGCQCCDKQCFYYQQLYRGNYGYDHSCCQCIAEYTVNNNTITELTIIGSLFLEDNEWEQFFSLTALLLSLEQLLFTEQTNIHTLPAIIGSLKHLKGLEISGSYIHTLPNTFSQLQSLEYLNLENSYFHSIPVEIVPLSHLQSFKFQYNILEDLSETTLAFLQQLINCEYTYQIKNSNECEPGSNIKNIWMDAGQEKFSECEYYEEDLPSNSDTIRKYCPVCMPWMHILTPEYQIANKYFNQQYSVEETAYRWYTEIPKNKRKSLIEEQEMLEKKIRVEKEAINRMHYYLQNQQLDKQYTDQELLEQWNKLGPEEQVMVQHRIRNMKSKARKKAKKEKKKNIHTIEKKKTLSE